MLDAADQASWMPERGMYSNECDMFELIVYSMAWKYKVRSMKIILLNWASVAEKSLFAFQKTGDGWRMVTMKDPSHSQGLCSQSMPVCRSNRKL